MNNNLFTTKCDTCGDESDSEPGLPCGRPIGPPGHDDDHPDAVPCTGTYQPSPPAPADPMSWRELFSRMTPVMWLRLAVLAALTLALTLVWAVGVVVAIVRGVTGH